MQIEINWHNNIFKRVLHKEQEILKDLCRHYPVRHVLQLGGTPLLLDKIDVISKSIVQNQFHQYEENTLIGNYDELPIAVHSVDTIIVPHTLEIVEHPSVVLKEIYHVLPMGGRLILFHFNPCSLLGLLKSCHYKKFNYPDRHFYTSGKLRHWLKLIGYDLLMRQSFGFFIPQDEKTHLAIDYYLEKMGGKCASSWGAVNVLMLEKKAYSGRFVPCRTEKYKKTSLQPNVAMRS